MIVKQLAFALDALEGVGVVLCDLRPSKVLFTSKECWDIKIAEFGRAVLVPSVTEMEKLKHETKKSKAKRSSTITAEEMAKMEKEGRAARSKPPACKPVGGQHLLGRSIPGGLDPAYVAPEIVGSQTYTFACDIWALGCTTYAMLSGRAPFDFGERRPEVQHPAQKMQHTSSARAAAKTPKLKKASSAGTHNLKRSTSKSNLLPCAPRGRVCAPHARHIHRADTARSLPRGRRCGQGRSVHDGVRALTEGVRQSCRLLPLCLPQPRLRMRRRLSVVYTLLYLRFILLHIIYIYFLNNRASREH